ncbi:MAG: flagellar basal body rod protein FlgC [Candidatus Zixiibacteriota bacterium]
MAGFLKSIDVSAQGLTIQRRKMDAVAQNIANAETTRTPEGGPYRRQRVVVEGNKNELPFNSLLSQANTKLARTDGRHLSGKSLSTMNKVDQYSATGEVVQDPKNLFKLVHDPSHPDADEQGYVKMPDVEIVTEMVDMMVASRAYEANATAISTAKKMANDALDI